MIDERFLFRVADYMLPLSQEKGPLDDDRAETLKELKIITGGFRCC
ncbi:MAG: hypothetical protein J6M91_03670 [Methanobrevibacter sp.]|nr:hypothetical protein [Methanobrevibacter sp.]